VIVGCGESFGAEGFQDIHVLQFEKRRSDRDLEFWREISLHDHRIIRDRVAFRQHYYLVAIDGTLGDQRLEYLLAKAASLHLAGLNGTCDGVMSASDFTGPSARVMMTLL